MTDAKSNRSAKGQDNPHSTSTLWPDWVDCSETIALFQIAKRLSSDKLGAIMEGIPTRRKLLLIFLSATAADIASCDFEGIGNLAHRGELPLSAKYSMAILALQLACSSQGYPQDFARHPRKAK